MATEKITGEDIFDLKSVNETVNVLKSKLVDLKYHFKSAAKAATEATVAYNELEELLNAGNKMVEKANKLEL